MRKRMYYRWSDNQWRWGRLILAWDKSSEWAKIALMLTSGNHDDDTWCTFRFTLCKATLILLLPDLIAPYGELVRSSIPGNKPYMDYHRREYGFSIHGGDFFQLFYGPQTDDSSTEKRYSKFLPFSSWRLTSIKYYDNNRDVWACANHNLDFRKRDEVLKKLPKVHFDLIDYDGTKVIASTYIEEYRWKLGTGWFKWLSWFSRDKVRMSLDIQFNVQVGPGKHSWKGGTLGHGISLIRPDEYHNEAMFRYCQEHKLTYVGVCDGFPETTVERPESDRPKEVPGSSASKPKSNT